MAHRFFKYILGLLFVIALLPMQLFAAINVTFETQWTNTPQVFINPVDTAFDRATDTYYALLSDNSVKTYNATTGNEIDEFTLVTSPEVIQGIDVHPVTKNIYATSSSGVVKIFDEEGVFLSDYGTSILSDPGAISVDSAGNTFVGDVSLEKIFFFDSSGVYILDQDIVGGPTFIEEKGGIVYAVPSESSDIVKYQTNGTYIETIDTLFRIFGLAIRNDNKIVRGMNVRDFNTVTVLNEDGTEFFYFPSLASVASVEVSNDDAVVIGDLSNSGGQVQKFSVSGDLIFPIPLAPDIKFNRSNGIVVSSVGNFYVSNTDSGKITVFNPSGELINTFGANGSENGEHQSPLGLAIDSADNIYVADWGNFRIQVYSSSGTYLRQWETSLDSVQTEPTDITIANNKLYAIGSLSGDPVIQVFDLLGDQLFSFGSYGIGDGQFQSVSGITHDSSGHIYVSDSSLNRVQIFSANGSYISQLSTYGENEDTFSNIKTITTDSHDNIYIFEENNYRIIVLNSVGDLITTFGENGSDPGQFIDIRAIFVTSNKIFVTDWAKPTVEVFSYIDNTVYPDPIVTPVVSSSRSSLLPLSVLQALSDAMRNIKPVEKACYADNAFTQNLKRGMRTVAISKVQQFLLKQGLYNGPITTYFGPLTEAAVNRFQTLHKKNILEPSGLKNPTGNWYSATRAKANSLIDC